MSQKWVFTAILFIGHASQHFLFAQSETYLSSFNVYAADYRVYINPVISAGRICSGISFQRSEDGISFYEIGEIPGDCGSILVPVSYMFIDESPIFNRKVYYRVDLRGFGYSDVREIELVDTRVTGFQIRPNPFNYETGIYFENPNGNKHFLKLFNLAGKLIAEKDSRESKFLIEELLLNSGMYFFTITGPEGESVVSGRLIKL